jgi:hypothetical protein
MQRVADVLSGNGEGDRDLPRGRSHKDVKAEATSANPAAPPSPPQDDLQSEASGTMKFSNTAFYRGRVESDAVSVDSTQEVPLSPSPSFFILVRSTQLSNISNVLQFSNQSHLTLT